LSSSLCQNVRGGTQLFAALLALVLLLGGVLWFNLAFVAASLLAAPYAGRVFCGWLCPLGAFLERLLPPVSRQRRFQRRPVLRYSLLVVFLVAFGYLFLRPVAGLPSSLLLMGTMFVMGTLTAWLWSPRAWCGHLCPWGTLADVLSSRARWRLAIAGDCRHCGACVRACPVGSLLAAAVKDRRRSALGLVGPGCVRCLRCQAVCPSGAIDFVRVVRAGGERVARTA